jgi:hypothetical protein
MHEPNRLVERIAADLAQVWWPDAAEIRARLARRRRRRAIAASGLATVVAIAVALPAALSLRAPDDTGPPVTTAPPLVEIPPEALLQPEDVGPGLIARGVSIDENAGLPALPSTMAMTCAAYDSRDAYRDPVRYQRAATVATPPSGPGDPAGGDPIISQTVLRLTGDRAPRVVDELRVNLRACAEYVSRGPVQAGPEVIEGVATHRWRILYERFAGDDSLVFAHDVEAVRLSDGGRDKPLATYLTAVVRVGDLVTLLDWNQPGVEPGEVRRLATRAASWLCVASNPPC